MNIDIHCTHISPMMTLANCCSPHLAWLCPWVGIMVTA